MEKSRNEHMCHDVKFFLTKLTGNLSVSENPNITEQRS